MKVFGVVLLIVVGLGAAFYWGTTNPAQMAPTVSKGSFQQKMDGYRAAKLEAGYLSKLSADVRKTANMRSFYSLKLHTCLSVDIMQDPKNMNYIVSDLTYGFIATPSWHPYDRPLHVSQRDYGRDHHFYAEGYWESTSSDSDQKLASQANAVKLTCDYTDGRRADDEANSCTETDATVQFVSLQTDAQTYHIVSWSPDEVIATQSDRGFSGSTTTTLIIHPRANRVEVIDRTRMDEKQPELTKGMAGKAFGGHYELKGGEYLIDTQGMLFQCDEDGVVTDMRTDVVAKHNGDVVNVPNSEWNAGVKADHKFTQQECDAAMQRKLEQLH